MATKAKKIKVVTIASLVRAAARSEAEFVQTVESVFEDEDIERTAEFFDKLNVPRSVGAEGGLQDAIPVIGGNSGVVTDYLAEEKIGEGIRKYLDRHERKIKWHAKHPALDEGLQNVLLVFREAMIVTNMRLNRLNNLMNTKDELTPVEWGIARRLMRSSYMSFRNFLSLVSRDWIDAMQTAVPRDELADQLGNFYELVDGEIRKLEEYHDLIEERRQDLSVVPDGHKPVKPPVYFGPDIFARGPWKQLWNDIDTMAHHFRESVV
jgi:hypothetical protein